MNRIAVFAALLLLTGTTASSSRDSSSFDLIRFLMERPWMKGHMHRDGVPLTSLDAGSNYQTSMNDPGVEEYSRNYVDDVMRSSSTKRSAVATALNGRRRRRQPAPALGKAVTPYIGVGVLNDMGSFFDSLRDNLETLASLSPQERSSLFPDTPNVVQAPLSGSGGGGVVRRPHALRPLRTASSIRSYNRRSFIDPDVGYPGANHHDPGLLWTGLGRR